jgi:hypothetical protein
MATTLRGVLSDRGVIESDANAILERMREFYYRMDRQFPFGLHLDEAHLTSEQRAAVALAVDVAFRELSERIHRLTNELLLERLVLEEERQLLINDSHD